MAYFRSGGRSGDLRATREPASVVELLENHLKPGAIILKRGHVQQSSSCQTSVCIIRGLFRWASRFLKVDMNCLWLLRGMQGNPIFLNLARRFKLPRLVRFLKMRSFGSFVPQILCTVTWYCPRNH